MAADWVEWRIEQRWQGSLLRQHLLTGCQPSQQPIHGGSPTRASWIKLPDSIPGKLQLLFQELFVLAWNRAGELHGGGANTDHFRGLGKCLSPHRGCLRASEPDQSLPIRLVPQALPNPLCYEAITNLIVKDSIQQQAAKRPRGRGHSSRPKASILRPIGLP